jgi:hypothetical protein
VTFIDLAPDGSVQPVGEGKSAARGVKIVFSGSDARPRTLYYFRTDLSNRGIQNSGFLEFCAQFGVSDVFIKAASYLLHNAAFSTLRDFLLSHGASIVQDDTGIPARFFEKAKWELRPFGKYVGPIPIFRGNYQAKLKDMFTKGSPPPIDFGIGYRWRPNQSHVLLAVNRNPVAPGTAPASATPVKKAAAKRPAPAQPAQDASVLAGWRRALMGGFVTDGLVAMFGLQGVANALGFVIQTGAVGGATWLVAGLLRDRGRVPPASAET